MLYQLLLSVSVVCLFLYFTSYEKKREKGKREKNI